MNFTLSQAVRQNIANEFLKKNDADFHCIIKYDRDSIPLKYKMQVLFENGFSDIQVIESILYHNVTNFIQNSFWAASEKIALLFGLALEKKIFYEPDFSILANATQKHKISFNNKNNRTELISDVFKKLGMTLNSNRTMPVQQIMDELMMNAQVNAPKLSTMQNVADSVLIVEKNEKLIAISVIDYYGTLDSKKFLKKIEGSLKLGRGESINFNRSNGAGLGGSIVFGHSDTLLMGCVRTKIARVTSVLPYNIAENNYSFIQKSISIID